QVVQANMVERYCRTIAALETSVQFCSKLSVLLQPPPHQRVEIDCSVWMPSAETENDHQIVFKPRLLQIALLAGWDNRKFVTAISKEEFPADDVISRHRCRLDAVHARLSFVFLAHIPKCKSSAYRR